MLIDITVGLGRCMSALQLPNYLGVWKLAKLSFFQPRQPASCQYLQRAHGLRAHSSLLAALIELALVYYREFWY